MPNELARVLRKHLTPTERLLWHWLRHRYLGGYKFRRQHPIGPYILDFYCAELKLCLEVDGGVHDTPERIARDEARTRFLNSLGITVTRIRNEHIREQRDGAWDAIVDAIVRLVSERTGLPYVEVLRKTLSPSRRSPSPLPLSPQAGRGDEG